MIADIIYFEKNKPIMELKSIFGSKKDIINGSKKTAYALGMDGLKIIFPDNTIKTYVKKGKLWYKQ